MPKQCFVIGPIGEADSEIRKAADRFMKHIVEPTLVKFDYEPPRRADKLGEPGRIPPQIIRWLRDADLVIADLTGNNPNVFYELSLRQAIGKPAIHMAEQGTVLAFDIHDNRTIFYTMDISDVEEACAELARQIERIGTAGYKASNPIVDAIPIIELAKSDNPMQQTLSSVVQTVEGLAAEVRRLSAAQSTTAQSTTANLSLFNNPSSVLTGALTGVQPRGLLDFPTDTLLGAAVRAAEAEKAEKAAQAAEAAEAAEAEKATKPKEKG